MARLILSVVIMGLFTDHCFSMTRQQMKGSGKLLKKACMPKNDVTEDKVGEIEQGKFLEERNVMCYIACIYTMGQVVKNNKLVYDAMVKQVDMMYPPEIKDIAKAAIDKCRVSVPEKNPKEVCEESYLVAKCMYDHDPANFFFP